LSGKKAHLMFNGLGAGNIGDEAMFSGFLQGCSLLRSSTVEVYDPSSPIIETLPIEFQYTDWRNDEKNDRLAKSAGVALLVGDTPVMSEWGLDWPMRALAKRLLFCHSQGVPVHAVGVGVDVLNEKKARQIFSDAFLPITSWTVRTPKCQDCLIDLGVSSERIAVGADLAWLFVPEIKDWEWANIFWQKLGVDLLRPLVAVNVVNERWAGRNEVKAAIAAALDQIIRATDIQVAFLCNETREGDYFDSTAAGEVIKEMKEAAYMVPNHYFTPSQMAALLSYCSLTLSQRYHFTVLSIIAGTACLSFARGQKMVSLLEEFNEIQVGTMENCDPGLLKERIVTALNNGHDICERQKLVARHLELRAKNNFHFVSSSNPKIRPAFQLASVSELKSPGFRDFMEMVNNIASMWGLRQFVDWSKVWEYPWLWFNGLQDVTSFQMKVLDIGSELSPMPWFFASLGAHVTLVESNTQWIPTWERIVKETSLNVEWFIAHDEHLPFPQRHFDVVTSFSVIEHQSDKRRAIDEVARVLKPGGMFAMSFDICEPDMGMIFPEWNGKALTMKEFEELVWENPAFDNGGKKPHWNVDDCAEFIKWHLQSAPYHNYVVGAAILRKVVQGRTLNV